MGQRARAGGAAAGLGRRAWLQSAGAILGAAAMAGMASSARAQTAAPAPGTGGATGSTGAADDSSLAGMATSMMEKRQVGFTLSHEQFTLAQLVELAVAAEQAGFALISTSDHFQPWQPSEGH